MSAEECRKADALTRQSGQGKRRCASFDAACPDCGCENHSIGLGSPGIVSSAETLARFHFSPNDVDDNGKPTPFAFSDVAELGLSVTREQASDLVMTAAIAKRLDNLDASADWHSVSLASVADIRSIHRSLQNKPLERAFGVYDTAEPDNPEHAEVMQTKAGRSLRSELRKKFSAVDRRDYRSGRLQPCRSGKPG